MRKLQMVYLIRDLEVIDGGSNGCYGAGGV